MLFFVIPILQNIKKFKLFGLTKERSQKRTAHKIIQNEKTITKIGFLYEENPLIPRIKRREPTR